MTYPPDFPNVPPTIESHLHHGHLQTNVPEIVDDQASASSSQLWTSDAVSLKSSKSNNVQPTADRTFSSTHPSTFLSVTNGDKKMAASEEDVSKLGEGLEKLKVEVTDELDDPEDFQDAEDDVDNQGSVKVVFLTEQISHHPPASSYYFAAPDKGVEAAGVDQIGAKVSGTSTFELALLCLTLSNSWIGSFSQPYGSPLEI